MTALKQQQVTAALAVQRTVEYFLCDEEQQIS